MVDKIVISEENAKLLEEFKSYMEEMDKIMSEDTSFEFTMEDGEWLEDLEESDDLERYTNKNSVDSSIQELESFKDRDITDGENISELGKI